ncbi:MAG: hypothetical protein ABII82_15390 [Verrucomicrobiota bacterium]
MKTSTLSAVSFSVILAAGLAGCGQSEPAAPDAPSEAPTAKVEVGVSMEQVATRAEALAKSVGIELKIPDFKTASVADISKVASQALSGLGSVVESSPAAVKQVQAVQSSLTAGDAKAALASLSGLGDLVKNIPAAATLLEQSKQLVSAWALKQGFDPAKISGVLGALQTGDLGALAKQATALLGKGGVSGEQSDLLKGVLNTFGIDSSSAAGALNAAKGLFGQ